MRDNEWIPVKSGMFPKNDEIVQVTYIGINNKIYCDQFAIFNNGHWYWYDECTEIDEETEEILYATPVKTKIKITAWKHMCEPYLETE